MIGFGAGKPGFPLYQCVDVRDVAYAHVMGFEKSSASGRYLLVAESLTRIQLGHLLHKLYPSIVDAPIIRSFLFNRLTTSFLLIIYNLVFITKVGYQCYKLHEL